MEALEDRKLVVRFDLKDVMLFIIPALLTSKCDVSHRIAETFSEAVLKDYNLRDVGYQLLHEDSIYSQICDHDQRLIDDKLSEAEKLLLED